MKYYFDWKFYYTHYKDLIKAGINTEKKCLTHWNKYGKNEGRIYNRQMLKDNFDIEFKILLNNVKQYDCPCKASFNIDVFHKLWTFLHKLSLRYDISMKSQIKNIMSDLKNINCKECRKHYIEYYNKQNINDCLKNKKNVINFFFNLHNDVNKRNNKAILTIENFYKKYARVPPRLLAR
jgi:hypothetical protein